MNTQRWSLVVAIVLTAAAFAQQPAGNGYEVVQSVIANGGGTSSGASVRVTGTFGQSEVDPLQPSFGAGFAITGGFWRTVDAPATTDRIFADDFD